MKRLEKMIQVELILYSIIPIVKYGWSGSFQNVTNNLKAILERGWNWLNQMLLLHPDLRKTMTDRDLKDELESNLFPVNRLQQDNWVTVNNNLPTMRTNNNTTHQQHHLHSSSSTSNLNMQGMATKLYIEKLVRECPHTNKNKIKEGDKVEITNNHQGLQGTRGARGKVISVTPKQVSLQIKGSKNIIY
jgi:hypothetical protein